MIDAHSIPHAIAWHEGMMLTPQHFQEMDRRTDALFHYYGRHQAPYIWGILHQEIDHTLLTEGLFRINTLEAIMPDGLVAAVRDKSDQHLEMDLKPYFETLKGAPSKIFLGVIRQSGESTDSDLRRFESAEGEPVADAMTGEGAERIPRLVPRLKLIFGSPSKLYAAMPVAELTYKDNMLTLTDFCPPVVSLEKDSHIMNLCQKLGATLRRKANHLSGILASGDQAEEQMVRETKETLSYLVGGLPHFEAILGEARPHPYRVYLSLITLLSQLVNLSKSRIPPLLKPYNHADALASFREADDYMMMVLNERIQETYELELFRRDGDAYVIPFKSQWLGRELILGFAREPGSRDRDAVDWVTGALIGARSFMTDLRSRRVLGLGREAIEKAPRLSPPENTLLFRLDANSRWLVPDDDLVVSPSSNYAGKLKPLGLKLFIRNPEGGSK